jgi:hypothetical protein
VSRRIARGLAVLVLALLLLPAGVAHGAPARESRAVLGILVQFSDHAAQTSAADWRRRLFGRGDSVRTSLAGALDVFPAAETHGTTDDGIIGWLTLDRRHPDFGGTVDTDARHLTHDALVAAARHVRFADFDTDGDGVISADELVVLIVVAGNEAAAADACRPAVWAHHGEVASLPLDGVQLSAYAMLGEMHCAQPSPPGTPAPVGVLAHETAALLGLADDTDLAGPAAGEYTVVIPNGGEAWKIGTIRRIEWQSAILGNVSVELSRDGGATWTTIFAGLVNDGAHKWTVTGPATNRARLRVCSTAAPAVCDASDANFVINRGTVTVAAPNGGETWSMGSVRRMEWTSTVDGNVRIELSRDGGSSWATLFASLENDGGQNWTVTGPATSQARVRVCSVSTPRVCDSSNATFRIAAGGSANLLASLVNLPGLTVVGGQPWPVSILTSNLGTGTAGPSRTDVYLSKDRTFSGDDHRMASFSVPALGPGEVDGQSKIITFPFISSGFYFVAVRADALGAVAETDENNWVVLPSELRVLVIGLPFSADVLAAP